MIYGFDTATTTSLYSNDKADLGKAAYPWGRLWLSGSDSSHGKIERLGSSGATASDTFIIRQSNNTIESSLATSDSTSESSIVLQAATTCRKNLADATATGSLTIQTTAQGSTSTASMSVYPTIGGEFTTSFTRLGTPSAPWDIVFTKNLLLNGSFVTDFVVGAAPKSYQALTSTQMNGLPGSGKYLKRKWANGMQEVWIELKLGNITEWTAWGSSLYEHVYGKAVKWPVTWSGVPQVIMSASCSTDSIWVTPVNPTATDTGMISVKTAGHVARSDIKIHIYAVGLAG